MKKKYVKIYDKLEIRGKTYYEICFKLSNKETEELNFILFFICFFNT